jgi:hypothetical protein
MTPSTDKPRLTPKAWARSGFSPWGALLALVICIGWGWSLSARAQSAWDKRPEAEIELPANLPAFAANARLQPFYVSATSPYDFAIDTASVRRVNEHAIHATLVVTSAQGVRNLSIIGFRCNMSQRRLLAIGRPDGSWSQTPASEWKELSGAGPLNQAERVLVSSLCLGSTTNSDPRDVVRRLAATFTESKH